jgi:WD40 repeat protein/tRNA A-37 threonylcarbamoyl transferase component Bud32
MPSPVEVSQRLGDYELIEEIARGGMGIVYRARQASLQRVVALKLILTGRLATEAEMKRFRTEAEAAAHLDHPNIVPIYEVGESEGRHFFTMKFVEGGSVAEQIENRGLKIEDRAENHPPSSILHSQSSIASLVAKTARAIHYAHQRGILHRDLKPANILLDASGEPLVSDFGLAKRADEASGLTLSGTILGSPNYMAPEQAAGGTKQLTTAADIYSLGAILYHLLAGRPPFRADTPLETMRKVVEEEPVPPSKCEVRSAKCEPNQWLTRRTSHLAPDLETICLKCLEKDPARRYPSAEALAEDLERWQRHEPILARPSTTWERAAKWARRRPATALLLAGSFISVVAFVALLLFNERRVAHERDRALTNEIFAISEARRAESNALLARQNLYAADLFLASQFVEAGQLGPALQLLEGHRPQPREEDLRGFEWRYLRAQCEGAQRQILRGHTQTIRSLAFSADGRRLASGEGYQVFLWDTADWTLLDTLPDRSAMAELVDKGAQALQLMENNPAAAAKMVLGQESLERLIAKTRPDRAGASLSLAFSPDGQTLASGDDDDYIKFWNVRTRRLVSWIPETRARLNFLPGTNLIIAGAGFDFVSGSTGETRLYDISTGRVVFSFTNSGGLAALSADGRHLATTDSSGRVGMWDTATGERINYFRLDETGVHLLALSPDGRKLAFCLYDNRRFRLWDTVNPHHLADSEGHAARVTALAFSPDGKRIATASTDATVRLWDTRGHERARFAGHLKEVHVLAFSPDGRMLASAGKDQTVRVWDVESHRRDALPINLRPPLLFSDDSRRAVALDRDGQPVLWEIDSLSLLPVSDRTDLRPVFFATNIVGFMTRDSAAAPWQLELWDATTCALRSRVTFEASDRFDTRRSFSRDRRRLAAAIFDPAEVGVWDVATGRLERRLIAPSKHVVGVELSPDGNRVAVVGWRDRVSLWDVTSGAPLQSFDTRAAPVASHAFTPGGAMFLTGSSDNLIRLWDVTTGRLRGTLAGHGETPTRLVVSPDGRTLASSSGDGALKLWSLATGRELITLLRAAPLRDLAFSPDCQLLCGPDWGANLLVWRAPEAP